MLDVYWKKENDRYLVYVEDFAVHIADTEEQADRLVEYWKEHAEDLLQFARTE